MRVQYVGTQDAVLVGGREVKIGQVIEVSPELGRALLEQKDNWKAARGRNKPEEG